MQTGEELSEERRQEVGSFWDAAQVDYATLMRKSRPVRLLNCAIEERDGMALWNGKWVPNFKKFKKVH